MRTRFELDPSQIKELVDGPGESLREELRSQVASQLKEVELKRLVGGVERLLGSDLEGDEIAVADLDWESISNLVEVRIQDQFANRLKTYFEDPDDPRIVKTIQSALDEISGTQLSESDVIKILGMMIEGQQASFDKKSHKRIWLRTQRLRYVFYAADLLNQMNVDEIETSILSHLESARYQLQQAWGANELHRLRETRLSLIEDKFTDLIKQQFGEDDYQRHADQLIDKLPVNYQDYIRDILGVSAMSNLYRELFLRVISELWVEYLTEMEALRVAIGLEAYAQRDPLVQYKSRGFEMFQRLMEDMRVGVINRMFTFQPRNINRIQAVVEENKQSPQSA